MERTFEIGPRGGDFGGFGRFSLNPPPCSGAIGKQGGGVQLWNSTDYYRLDANVTLILLIHGMRVVHTTFEEIGHRSGIPSEVLECLGTRDPSIEASSRHTG